MQYIGQISGFMIWILKNLGNYKFSSVAEDRRLIKWCNTITAVMKNAGMTWKTELCFRLFLRYALIDLKDIKWQTYEVIPRMDVYFDET